MQAIPVYPVAVADTGPMGRRDVFNPFYPLGCLIAYAKVHAGGALKNHFDFGRVTPLKRDDLTAYYEQIDWNRPGVFLFSSYVWNHSLNLKIAAEVRRRSPASLLVFGGPQVPRAPGEDERFLVEHEMVDVLVRNEGELTMAAILEELAHAGVEDPRRVDYGRVDGIAGRHAAGDFFRTPDRGRIMDLSKIPSPYATGEFDHWNEAAHWALIETNRGCPYGCTFCDWGSTTLSKIYRISLERIFAEIDHVAQKKIPLLMICDANFGILERDVEITEYIVATKKRHGFPQKLAYANAKTAKPRLTQILKMLWDAQMIENGQISMQTTNAEVLRNVDRANIRTADYEKIINFFHGEGIPTASDMMLGMPGQNYETTKEDLQFFFDYRTTAVIFATSVMPNAPMADPDYKKRLKVVVDRDGLVESTYSFGREEYQRMFELCLAYKFLVKLGVAKYLLYFMQVEHGVPAMDFVATWIHSEKASQLPLSARVHRDMLLKQRGATRDWLILAWSDREARFLFDEPRSFLDELVHLYETVFSVNARGSALDAVLSAQSAVLPKQGRETPCEVSLGHDVVSYFTQLRGMGRLRPRHAGLRLLSDFDEGSLTIAAQPAIKNYAHADFNMYTGGLELRSNLSV